MNNDTPVGIDRRIQLPWLESTASLFLAGTTLKEINSALREMLGDKLSTGAGGRGSLEKTVTVLMRIWANTPQKLLPFRDEGLKLLQVGSKEDSVAVHWGMTIVVYPFWGIVAEVTGKLLKLQGSATMAQIVLRVKEQLGERGTVIRSAQRAVRSYIDWGALLGTSGKGVYRAAPQIAVRDEKVGTWLIEAVLRSSGSESASLKALVNSPKIFPFKIAPPQFSKTAGRVELHRQGLDEDVLVLRN